MDVNPLLFLIGLVALVLVVSATWKLAGMFGRSRWAWTIATVIFPIALPILVLVGEKEGSIVFGHGHVDDYTR